MPSEDSRKDFILTTSANFFGLQSSDHTVKSGDTSTVLNRFLDDENCSLLTAFLTGHQSKKIVFFNEIERGKSAEDADDGFLAFFKIKPCVINPENIHNAILVSSMFGSPATTLYHTLHNLFAPNLLQNEKDDSDISEKLQNLIKELEFGLGSWLRKDGPKVARKKDGSIDEENLSAIFTPDDEFQFWGDLAVSEKESQTRKRASSFLEIFQRGMLCILF